MKRKIGRNDACWCASGKKYKKCHMGADRSGRSTSAPPAPRRAKRKLRRRTDLILPKEDWDGMRAAGRFNAEVMDLVREQIRPGVVLNDLDTMVREYTQDHGHVPACLGYKKFPKSLCASPNEVVCHGIPDDTAMREGDILNIDLTSIVAGWHGDQNETFFIGEVSDEARRLVQCAFDGMHAGIAAIKPHGKVIDIGFAIQALAHNRGFSVVEAFQGHGIGKTFHQDPGVPHYPEPHGGEFVVEPGMCFTIEPMINAGEKGCVVDKSDGWTARTVDGKLSAQFEHTILMTEDGPEILTLTQNGPQKGRRF